MLLGLNGVIDRAGAQDLEVRDAHLVPPRGPSVRPDLPRYRNTRLLRQLGEPIPDLGRKLSPDEDGLEETGAVAQHDEGDFAGGADVGDPPPHGHRGPDMRRQVRDRGDGV